jgi:hypothetical protein
LLPPLRCRVAAAAALPPPLLLLRCCAAAALLPWPLPLYFVAFRPPVQVSDPGGQPVWPT